MSGNITSQDAPWSAISITNSTATTNMNHAASQMTVTLFSTALSEMAPGRVKPEVFPVPHRQNSIPVLSIIAITLGATSLLVVILGMLFLIVRRRKRPYPHPRRESVVLYSYTHPNPKSNSDSNSVKGGAEGIGQEFRPLNLYPLRKTEVGTMSDNSLASMYTSCANHEVEPSVPAGSGQRERERQSVIQVVRRSYVPLSMMPVVKGEVEAGESQRESQPVGYAQ